MTRSPAPLPALPRPSPTSGQHLDQAAARKASSKQATSNRLPAPSPRPGSKRNHRPSCSKLSSVTEPLSLGSPLTHRRQMSPVGFDDHPPVGAAGPGRVGGMDAVWDWKQSPGAVAVRKGCGGRGGGRGRWLGQGDRCEPLKAAYFKGSRRQESGDFIAKLLRAGAE